MRRGFQLRSAIFPIVLLVSSVLPATAARAALSVRVIDPASVRAASSPLGEGQARFVSAAGVEMTLALDPSRLDLSNPLAGDAFVPMAAGSVRHAIDDLRIPTGPELTVTVYCLPGLPLEFGQSFCRDAEVFLAPGLAEVPANLVAYTVVHELGHALQHLAMPQRRGARWEEYLRLRGIDDERLFDPAGLHRNRPQEIFAEDFRVLCGGALANYSGTIENPSLPLPQHVEGLEGFFRALLEGSAPAAVRAYNAPNPFNPSTTIAIVFPVAAPASGAQIHVFDLRGRHVRTLNAVAAGNRLTATWHGRDDGGRPVASGRYLYRASCVGETVTGSMLLVE